MFALICVCITSLVIVSLGLLAFMVWRDMEQRKQIDELTSKIQARSLNEYALAKQTMVTPAVAREEKPKKVTDSVLGSHY